VVRVALVVPWRVRLSLAAVPPLIVALLARVRVAVLPIDRAEAVVMVAREEAVRVVVPERVVVVLVRVVVSPRVIRVVPALSSILLPLIRMLPAMVRLPVGVRVLLLSKNWRFPLVA
jgi:hypothetical protein